MKLLVEDYDKLKHAVLKADHDAFGNEVEVKKGYSILKNGEVIKEGDIHFDIYAGWSGPVSANNFEVKNCHHVYYNGGRWTSWARKLKHKINI